MDTAQFYKTNFASPFSACVGKKEHHPFPGPDKKPEHTDETVSSNPGKKNGLLMPSPMPQYTDGHEATGNEGTQSGR